MAKVSKEALARSARAKKAWKTRKRNAVGREGVKALEAAELAGSDRIYGDDPKSDPTASMKQEGLIIGTYMPPREGILREGIEKTLGSRNKSYGDPSFNFACTTALKQAFWNYMAMSGKNSVQQNSPFGHAIDMVLTNLARIATSPTTHVERDRFVDAATYMAIAFEVGR